MQFYGVWEAEAEQLLGVEVKSSPTFKNATAMVALWLELWFQCLGPAVCDLPHDFGDDLVVFLFLPSPALLCGDCISWTAKLSQSVYSVERE